MTGRAVKEWVGKTPDSKVPDSVRDRVLERYDHTCWLSGRPIAAGDKFEMEHKVPLWLGGEHREKNLAPALAEPHRRKSAAEAKVRAKVTRQRQKHYGMSKRKGRALPGSRASKWKTRLTSEGPRTERRT